MPTPATTANPADLTGFSQVGLYRMSQRGITRRGVRATLYTILLAAVLLAGPAAPARSQPDPTPDRPDEAETISAFLRLRQWTDNLAAPRVDAPEARLPIADATGVCVILRRAGRVVGTGTDIRGDELMVRRAFGNAFAQLLGSETYRNLSESTQDALGPELTLELEVAGPRTALPGRTFEHITGQLRPGLDGLAIQYDGRWAYAFPARLRVRNAHPGQVRAGLGLVSQLGLKPDEYRELTRRHRVSAYRFRTVHLVQSDADDMPHQTVRGHRVIDAGAVDRDAVETLGMHLLQHIERRRWPSDVDARGLRGDYDAATDQFIDRRATLMDHGLILAGLARIATASSVSDSLANRARHLAEMLMADTVTLAERAGSSRTVPFGSTLVHVAAFDPRLLEIRGAGALHDQAVEAVERWWRGEASGESVSTHDQAMALSAIGLLARAEELEIDADTFRSRLDEMWDSVPEPQRITLLPWIAWAEQSHMMLNGWWQRRQTMADLVDMLSAARFTLTRDPAQTDLVGGFELETVDGPQVTAQSLRPAVFLAMMASEHGPLTDAAERRAVRTEMKSMVRYLMQLAVGEGDAWLVRNAYRARGGLRQATWDATQPTAAQAMALLFLADWLELDAATEASE